MEGFAVAEGHCPGLAWDRGSGLILLLHSSLIPPAWKRGESHAVHTQHDAWVTSIKCPTCMSRHTLAVVCNSTHTTEKREKGESHSVNGRRRGRKKGCKDTSNINPSSSVLQTCTLKVHRANYAIHLDLKSLTLLFLQSLVPNLYLTRCPLTLH